MIIVRDKVMIRRKSAVSLGATAEATSDSREQNPVYDKVVQYNCRSNHKENRCIYRNLVSLAQMYCLKSVFEIETSMLVL